MAKFISDLLINWESSNYIRVIQEESPRPRPPTIGAFGFVCTYVKRQHVRQHDIVSASV